MRYLIILFLFPITYYGQVAIGTSNKVNSNVILDLTNRENRGLLLNNTNLSPKKPLGNIFYNNSKDMIGVVVDTNVSANGINYLSPWKHTDANSDVTFTSGIGKVIIKNSNAADSGRIILEVEEGSVNVKNGKIKEDGHDLVPAGCVMMWAGTTLPSGWLLCDGSLKNKTDYPDLFTILNSTYGPQTSDKFRLPNFINNFPKGDSINLAGDIGGQKEFAITKENLPPISHSHSIGHDHSIDHGHGDSTSSADGGHSHDTNIDYGSGSGGTNNDAGSTYNAARGQVNTSYQANHKHDTYTRDHTGVSGGASNGDSGLSPTSTPTSTAYKSKKIDNQPPFLSIPYIIKY